MEKEFFKIFYKLEKGGDSSDFDFDVREAKKKLVKAYHPDTPEGDNEKMKEINIAFDRKDYDYIMKELDLLKEKEEISAEENKYLQNNRNEVTKILDESPEIAEEVFDAMRKGDYRDAVDTLLERLKKEGKLKFVKIDERESVIKMVPYQKKKKIVEEEPIEESKKKKEGFAYEKLSAIQNMMSEMKSMRKEKDLNENVNFSESFDGRLDQEELIEYPWDETIGVVDFGGKKKENLNVRQQHRRLKDWTPRMVKEDQVSFIGDIINNIQLQKVSGREVGIPKKALNIVVKLLEREIDASDEEGNRIISSARESFNSEDTDLILKELQLAEDYFRVDGVFKKYLQKNGAKKEYDLGTEELISEKPAMEEENVKSGRLSSKVIDKEKLSKEIDEAKEKVSSLKNVFPVKEYTISELVTKKAEESGVVKNDNLNSKKEKVVNLNRDGFQKSIGVNNAKANKKVLENGLRPNEKQQEQREKVEIKKVDDIKQVNKEQRNKAYLEAVKKILEARSNVEKLQKDRISKAEISERLGVKNLQDTKTEEDYKKVGKIYETLKENLASEIGVSHEDIGKKIDSLSEEIKENESRFKKERAKEYIQHIKKIVDYQKESLPDKKKKLFEKMISVARDKRTQILLGAVILGVSIAVPEVGGAAWLTGGLVGGFLPVEAGIPLKVAGGVAGGYLMEGGTGAIYRKLLGYRKEIVKKIEDTLNNVVEFSVPKFDNLHNVRSVGFFGGDSVKLKSNFLEVKKQIIES